MAPAKPFKAAIRAAANAARAAEAAAKTVVATNNQRRRRRPRTAKMYTAPSPGDWFAIKTSGTIDGSKVLCMDVVQRFSFTLGSNNTVFAAFNAVGNTVGMLFSGGTFTQSVIQMGQITTTNLQYIRFEKFTVEVVNTTAMANIAGSIYALSNEATIGEDIPTTAALVDSCYTSTTRHGSTVGFSAATAARGFTVAALPNGQAYFDRTSCIDSAGSATNWAANYGSSASTGLPSTYAPPMTVINLAFSVPGVAQSYELIVRGCVQLSYDPGVMLGELMSPTKVVSSTDVMKSVAGLRGVTLTKPSSHRSTEAYTGVSGIVGGVAGALVGARVGPRLGRMRQGGRFRYDL